MKRLVVCCDGTWDDADAQSDADRAAQFSNVVRMARAVRPHDACGVPQIVYYQSGVGTGGGQYENLVRGALGLGLARNVRNAYAFLADNYCAGDEIFLFGFSRGAYTARSVAGLVDWAGLLRKRDLDAFGVLWTAFKYRMSDRDDVPRLFEGRHVVVPIRCVGVWDTVGALGIPDNLLFAGKPFYRFLDTTLGRRVAFAFQALALDERRADYAPALWSRSDGAPAGQHLEQVWFAGAHCNIGGGYPEHGLSDLALAWMAGKVAGLLALDFDYLSDRQDRSAPWGMGRLYRSRVGWFLLRPARARRPLAPGPGRQARCERLHPSVVARLAPHAPCLPAPYRNWRAWRLARMRENVAPLTPDEWRLGWLGAPGFPPAMAAAQPVPVDTLGGARTCTIRAAARWSQTRLWLARGATYRFAASGRWTDGWVVCGPEGWPGRLAACVLRDARSNRLALIGTLDGDPATRFCIGAGGRWTAPANGWLVCCANTLRGLRIGAAGGVALTVEQVG